VRILHVERRLHLDEPPAAAPVALEHVDSREDAAGGEARLEDRGGARVERDERTDAGTAAAQERRRAPVRVRASGGSLYPRARKGPRVIPRYRASMDVAARSEPATADGVLATAREWIAAVERADVPELAQGRVTLPTGSELELLRRLDDGREVFALRYERPVHGAT
jgi:hypothetical protein